MRHTGTRLSIVTGTAARIGILLAALSMPVLAVPLMTADEGILVGGVVERPSGAGIVIVVGLQRAR